MATASLTALATTEGGEPDPCVAAPIVIDLADGADWVDRALSSDWYERLVALPAYDRFVSGRDARKARSRLRLFADLMQREPVDAIRAVLGRRLTIAIRPLPGRDPAFLLRTQCGDDVADRLSQVIEHLVTLSGDGDQADLDGAVRSADGKEHHAVLGDAFLLSNDRDWIERAVADAGSGGRAGATRAWMAEQNELRVHVDVHALREQTQFVLPERFDNALASLIVHGLFAAANRASTVDLTARCDAALEVEARVHTPQPDAASDWYFEDNSQSIPTPPGTLGWYRVGRDFGEFYRRRADLLDPSLEGDLIEFDNVISIFFGGRSFGDEVLPALGSEAVLVSGLQTYPDLERPPEVKIPAFALVARADDERMRTADWLVAFQTAVGIINADRAQNGKDPLLLATERHRGATVSSASFLPPEDERAPTMHYNASPAIAVGGGRVIIGSAKEQVLALLDALPDADEPPAANSELALAVPAIVGALRQNRRALVANRMIEHGETSSQAGEFLDDLYGALDLLDEVRVRIERDEGLIGRVRVSSSARSESER